MANRKKAYIKSKKQITFELLVGICAKLEDFAKL